MTNSHDHGAAATDLMSKRPTRRHRAPQHTTATPPAAPPPHQPTPARRRGDRHIDARPTPRTASGNGRTSAGETDAPLHALPAPLACVVTIRQPTRVEHEVVLRPGASAADMTTAMIMIPPGATLAGHRAGAAQSLSLLFREPPESPDGAAERPADSA